MTRWSVRGSFDILVIGQRLTILLLVVTAYYVVAGLLIQAFRLQVIHRGSAGSLMNTLLLGMLLGFRNQAAYARWWEARGLWGKLTNDIRNLAAKCAAFLPAEVLVRSNISSLLVDFPEALNRHLRGEAVPLGELPRLEHQQVESHHLPVDLANRLFATLATWKREGHVDQGVLVILDEHARGLLDVCGGCEKIKSTPLSAGYKVLLRAGLVLNVLAAPFLIVPEDGLFTLPVVLLVCFFLFGVELIDSIIEEPFGRDHDDLDLDRFCQTIREAVETSLPSVSNTGSSKGQPS